MKTKDKLAKVKYSILSMDKRSEFQPKENYNDYVQLRLQENSQELNLSMFSDVGRAYGWFERLTWTNSDWDKYFSDNDVIFYLGYHRNRIIGYLEMIHHASDEMEIVHFGLLPEFVGKGLGGYFLSQAIHAAWRFYPVRVFLNTCDTDHPAALQNYLKRGFKIIETGLRFENRPDKLEFERLSKAI